MPPATPWHSFKPSGPPQFLDLAPHHFDQLITIVKRVAGRLDRVADLHVDHHRPYEPAALLHRGAAAVDGDRDDRRLRLDRHDEAALLEWQELRGAAARAFRKNQEAVAIPDRLCGVFDRGHRCFLTLALDRHETAGHHHLAE